MKYLFIALLALALACAVYFTITNFKKPKEEIDAGTGGGGSWVGAANQVPVHTDGGAANNPPQVPPPATLAATRPPATIAATRPPATIAATRPPATIAATRPLATMNAGPTPEQIAAKRAAEIKRLLEEAVSNSTIRNGITGLNAVQKLLALDPQNKAALDLREKINKLYVTEAATGTRFVEIKPGTFQMGNPKEEEGFERDAMQHQVTLTKGFYMSVTEVTQKEWKAVMGYNRSRYQGDDLPAIDLSWREANEFCEKLSQKTGRKYRLPTEAEWEYACRAGTTTQFNTGNGEAALKKAGKYRNTFDNNDQTTVAVGSFAPNDWGLYDMHGNAREWCADKYRAFTPKDASMTDPLITKEAVDRVARGGCTTSNSNNCRSAGTRTYYREEYTDGICGIRLVRELD